MPGIRGMFFRRADARKEAPGRREGLEKMTQNIYNERKKPGRIVGRGRIQEGMSMQQDKIVYFEKKGPENTDAALRLAVEAARTLGIGRLVVATTAGGTPRHLMEQIDHDGLDVTVVAYAYGQKAPGSHPMPEELRQALTAHGFHVHSAAHALSGAERSLSGTFGGVFPVEIIAHTLRMFSQGVKVCVEICAMAADAGYVVSGQPVVAVAGSGSGADTVLVIRPEVSSRILQTRIDRVICKPVAE